MKKITLSTILLTVLASSSMAQTYSQSDMDSVLKRLDTLEKAKTSTNESIDDLYDRADENEFEATMNHIKWGAEFEVSDNFVNGKSQGTTYTDNNSLTTKLRLNMESKVNKKTKFTGRLSMYKGWSDSSSQALTDPAQGRKPVGSSAIYVERAYVDYSIVDSLIVTLGRQPSSDGPGMTLIENTKRKSTYPAILFDGATDGAVVTYKAMEKSAMKPTFRVAYGKGYQKKENYSPYAPNMETIDDLDVYGAFYEMSLPFKSMGENLLVLSYVHATNFVGHPQYTDAPNNKNLGDMDLAGVYFENNKAFGTNLNYFLSFGYNNPKSNGNTVNLINPTNPNYNMTLINKSGNAIQIGARYDFDSGIKIGYEFNHGSKYWYSFTNGSSDLLNKLATRGDVHEVYAMYQMDINQFIKLGYEDINYDYTGSGWHIGEPQKTDDYVRRGYLTYNLRF